MNALAHKTDLAIIAEEHAKNMRTLCEATLCDILLEARRINKRGRTVSVMLLDSFVSVIVHNTDDILMTVNASYDNPSELIDLLQALEKVPAPAVPDVENDIYDLEEETPDAETV